MTCIMKYIWSVCRVGGLTGMMNDECFVRLQYYAMLGKRLKLSHPVDFNEKVQWLKLHYRNPLMVTCADKWAVRKYVKDRIGEKYLAKCIGVYDEVDKIHVDELPDKFVLKATHGSGWNIICPDKSKIDWNLAKKKMRKWLKSDFSKVGREWQYHDIKPRILCEEFLEDLEYGMLRDYKLFTFNGETKYIWVDFTESRNADNKVLSQDIGYSKPIISKELVRYRNIYDTEWHFMSGRGSLYPCYDSPRQKKPEYLNEMIEMARRLASDFPVCRVDFYVIGGKKLVFGELTFSPGNGCNAFYPQSFNDELGTYIKIPQGIIR